MNVCETQSLKVASMLANKGQLDGQGISTINRATSRRGCYGWQEFMFRW